LSGHGTDSIHPRCVASSNEIERGREIRTGVQEQVSLLPIILLFALNLGWKGKDARRLRDELSEGRGGEGLCVIYLLI
jgi:hypothetical protein